MSGTPNESAPDPGDGGAAAAPDAATGGGPTAAADATADAGAGARPQPWWRPKPFARPVWYPVAAAAAVVALLAGVGMTLLTLTRGPQARPLAADCGLVTCGANLPPVVTGGTVPSTAVRSMAPARRHHRRAHRRVLTPAVHRLRPATPPARPRHRRHRVPPPATPRVTVSFTVDGTDPWHQDFHAHLTIVNNGPAPVAGWNVQVSLPGDQVDWVGYPGSWDPFASWQFGGGTLVLNAASGGETLAPGAAETVPIAAQGTNTTPGGCTFNGAPCGP